MNSSEHVVPEQQQTAQSIPQAMSTSPLFLAPARRLFTSAGGDEAWPLWAQLLVAALLGLSLGWAAWGEGRAPALAALLPFLLAVCRSRLQAFLVGMFYTSAVLRHAVEFIGSWFDNSLLIGGSAVLAYSVISGSIWALGWSRSDKAWRKALAVVIAWTVALMPPATVGMPGHPLIAWGSILPGAGWVGVVLAVALPAGVVWLIASHKPKAGYVAVGLSLAAVGLAMLGAVRYMPATSYGPGTVAVSTEWGKQDGVDDVLQRVASMGQMAKQLAQQDKPTTVIWPESILGNYDPALYPVLDIELLSAARASGQAHIIGMDLPDKNQRYENAAVAFYPDGRTARAVARQPAPMSLWKPWRTTDTYIADWSASNMLPVSNTMQGAFIFCYEEYLPVLYLMNEAQGQVDLYVAIANTWAAKNPEASEIQTQHSLGMARLFGRMYVKAENRPLPTK